MSNLDDKRQRLSANGFPDRLRQLRKQKNLSQTELAKLAGLHFMHYGRYERGESQPKADALKRLADALGVSGDYLMEGMPEEAAKGRFEDREFLRQFQEVEKLPEEDKLVVRRLIEAFLLKKKIHDLAVQ